METHASDSPMWRTLPSADQFGYGADGVLDRGVGVDAVLVVQVDLVGAEPLERPLHRGSDAGRAAVESALPATGVRDHAELGGEHYLVAAPLECPADEFLIDVRTVDLGGVDEVHAQIERAVDGPDRFGVVASGAGERERHAHGAEANPPHVQVSKFCSLHDRSFRCALIVLVGNKFQRRRARRRAGDGLDRPAVTAVLAAVRGVDQVVACGIASRRRNRRRSPDSVGAELAHGGAPGRRETRRRPGRSPSAYRSSSSTRTTQTILGVRSEPSRRIPADADLLCVAESHQFVIRPCRHLRSPRAGSEL